MIEKKFTFLSSNKEYTIAAKVWEPENMPIKGIVQISHGMSEYINRYKDFAKFLCDNGFVVCGNDHAGHGESSNNLFGHFGRGHGGITLVLDTGYVTKHLKKTYKNVPVFLLGHSMGSFVVRIFCYYNWTHIDGLILSGTSGSTMGTSQLIKLLNIAILLGKAETPAWLVSKLRYGKLNSRLEEKVTRFDWISRDKEVVDKYINDKLCRFTFTYKGFKDLFEMLQFINTDKCIQRYKKDMPILMISGTNDPIGGVNSSGVLEVYRKFLKYNIKDVNIKLYKHARHEILNEINREEVYNDILKWLNKRI